MDLQDIVRGLPKDIQKLLVEKVPASYAVWVEDDILHIDCIALCDQGGKADLDYISLCATLGWVDEAYLFTVREVNTNFYGKRIKTLRIARFEVVKEVFKALGGLPCTIDQEYCTLIEPLIQANPTPPKTLQRPIIRTLRDWPSFTHLMIKDEGEAT